MGGLCHLYFICYLLVRSYPIIPGIANPDLMIRRLETFARMITTGLVLDPDVRWQSVSIDWRSWFDFRRQHHPSRTSSHPIPTPSDSRPFSPRRKYVPAPFILFTTPTERVPLSPKINIIILRLEIRLPQPPPSHRTSPPPPLPIPPPPPPTNASSKPPSNSPSKNNSPSPSQGGPTSDTDGTASTSLPSFRSGLGSSWLSGGWRRERISIFICLGR